MPLPATSASTPASTPASARCLSPSSCHVVALRRTQKIYDYGATIKKFRLSHTSPNRIEPTEPTHSSPHSKSKQNIVKKRKQRRRRRHWHRLIMCGIWFIEYEPPLNCLKDQRPGSCQAISIARRCREGSLRGV